MTIGGREPDGLEPMPRMADRLRSRGYPGLELATHVFEGADHASCQAAASMALRVLYCEQGQA